MRTKQDTGFIMQCLPERLPFFNLIQRLGNLPDEEMFRIFNTGIGFCLVMGQGESHAIVDMAQKHGVEALHLGHAVLDPERRVIIEPRSLVGQGERFPRQ